MSMPGGVLYVVLSVIAAAIFIYCRKAFSVYNLHENSGLCVLAGQLKYGVSSAFLPNPKGRHRYTVTAKGGYLRLNHHAYNPDGGTWSLPPERGEQEYFDMKGKGNYTFIFTIGESYGYTDRVEIVNSSLWHDVEFSYIVE